MTKVLAKDISVVETLELLDSDFRDVAEGVAKGEYALWLGSGISRERVDDLDTLVRRILEYLAGKASAEANPGPYGRALDEALTLVLPPAEKAALDRNLPPATWPNIDAIVGQLVKRYALLLDIRVAGKEKDHLLWDVVDVRETYANDNLEPDCEHYAIAILALEGVIPKVASANWDGLFEKAVLAITDGNQSIVAVMVRADDIQGANGRCYLYKFHGCAVRAKQNEGLYREYIVGRDQQITDWPHDAKFAAMKNQLDGMSVSHRTLMIGLSAQDSNIKDIFSTGRQMLKREWPQHPPAYVFAGDELGAEQGGMLKSVYPDQYDDHQDEIKEASKIPAYGKPLLSALVLSVLGQKIGALIDLVHAPNLNADERMKLRGGAAGLRTLIARKGGAKPADQRAFMARLIGGMSRSLAMFRGDRNALAKGIYQPLGTAPLGQLANDPNINLSAMPELAVFLGTLGLGVTSDGWGVSQHVGPPNAGTFNVTSGTGKPQKVFVVANYEGLSKLVGDGIVNEGDPDSIVAVCSTPVARRQTSSSTSFGRDSNVLSCREFSFRELIDDVGSADQLLARFKEEATL